MKDQFLLWAAAASALWYFGCGIAEAAGGEHEQACQIKHALAGTKPGPACKPLESSCAFDETFTTNPATGEKECVPDSCLCLPPEPKPAMGECGTPNGEPEPVAVPILARAPMPRYWSREKCEWVEITGEPKCPGNEYCEHRKWLECENGNRRMPFRKDEEIEWLCPAAASADHERVKSRDQAEACEKKKPEQKVSELGENRTPVVEIEFSGKKHPKHESDITGTK